MKYLKNFRYLALLAVVGLLMFAPAAKANAQVRFGIGIGVPYGPPVCAYGYYPYYPYTCAPYGYYGPDWFYGGVFIGAGPWYHGYYGRGYGYGGYYGGYRGAYGYRGGYSYRGGVAAYPRGGYAGGYHGGGTVARSGFAGGSHISGGGSHFSGGGGGHFSGGGGHGGGGHR